MGDLPGGAMQLHPSLFKRKIIHVDMDAFYASVEVRDNPALRGKPVIVGGSPERRGVVATCSYEARKFGVHSAMSSRRAAALCPQAVFLKPQFEKYQQVSKEIRTIFRGYTDLIEPLSLDEAFLDVTVNSQGLYAVQIARKIKDEVKAKLQLTCSAGIGPNKMIAKIASDLDKPDGMTVVLPAQVEAFMQGLPLRKIPGVGPATEQRLAGLGYRQCSDLWAVPLAKLHEQLGERFGGWLYQRCRGIDERSVETSRIRKSLGRETTFSQDITDRDGLAAPLTSLVSEVIEMLKARSLRARRVTVKIKYADFKLVTRSATLPHLTSRFDEVHELAVYLLGKTAAGERRVRLLGIALSNFEA